MEDRVAEILAERSALPSDIALAVAASVFLHAGLIGLGVYAALRQPQLKTTSLVNVRFVRPQRPLTPTRPVTSTPKQITPKISEPRTEPVKPVQTKAPPAGQNTVPRSVSGKSTKKGSDAPIPPRAAPAPATTTPAVDVPIGGADVTGLEGGDFPYTIYIERMKTLIGNRWVRPSVPDNTTATVHFIIERDGRIHDAKLETVSGIGLYDRAALRAVIEASPLPPLPFAYNGTYLGVQLVFR